MTVEALKFRVVLFEDVTSTATAGVLCAGGISSRDAKWGSHISFCVCMRHHSQNISWANNTYGPTSWRMRVSRGSLFLAMLPVPPRPVVTIGFFKVGVSRSDGVIFGDCFASAMFPAPPRPCDESCEVILYDACTGRRY